MSSERLPGILLAGTATFFAIWACVLLASPGGSSVLEWIQLLVAVGFLAFALFALRDPSPRRSRQVRLILVGFALFGAVAVIGLAADDNSSRTWARLAWAALVLGSITALVAWWEAPQARRGTVVFGGVVALVLIVAGLGITLRCDQVLQRSWCDPSYEQEQALVERVVVEGDLLRTGRAGGDGGAALMAYLVPGTSIESNTSVPSGFEYEPRPVQSIEVERGRYTAEEGTEDVCTIDVKVEELPAGTVETVMVTCRGS